MGSAGRRQRTRKPAEDLWSRSSGRRILVEELWSKNSGRGALVEELRSMNSARRALVGELCLANAVRPSDVELIDRTCRGYPDVRARHEAGEYGEADLEILLLGTRAQWAREHPPPHAEAEGASASLRPVHNESDRGNVVGGGSTMVRGVIRAADVGVGGVQAQVLRSSATRGNSNGNVDGRRQSPLRSGARPISATHASAEIVGSKKFVGGNVETPDADDYELWAEFRAAHLLTFMVHYVAPAKQGRQQEQRGKSGGGSGGSSSNAKSTEGVDRGKSVKGGDRTSSGSRREGCCCYICDAPNHLSYDCPDHDEFDDDRDANCRKGDGGHRCRDNQPRKEKQASKTSSTKDADSSGGNAHGEEASCSMVGVVEPTISLALEAGEDFKVVASSMQANPTVVLLDGSCSHHLMGTKEAFADMQPSGDIRHVRGFTGALKSIKGRGTVALQGEAWKQVLVPDVLYVPDVHVNLLSAGQLKENGVKRQNDGGEMLLVSSAGDVLGRARYSGRVLCTDVRPYSTKLTPTSMEDVAL
ncbi:unnamed protein product [Closterium sp. NIES-53]